MAIYGINYYGDTALSYYGQRPFIAFSAAPFSATSPDYGKAFLNWAVPTGNYTSFRLVRNSIGNPIDKDDGVILLDTTAALGIPNNYMDTGLKEGSFYYYTIFVLSTGTPNSWINAGSTTVLVTKNYQYAATLVKNLPTVYRTDTDEVTTANDNGTLANFLKIFGFQLDHIRSEYDSLTNLYDPDKVAGGMLPPILHQFGFAYDVELGQKRNRVLAKNAVRIQKQRGTIPGATLLINSITGWSNTITTGVNLALDNSEASFEQTLGHWGIRSDSPVAATIAQVAGAGWQDPTNAVVSNGYATVTTGVTAGNVWVASSTDKLSMIPVTVGTTYTASIYTWAVTTARSNQLVIDWYDINGVYLSSSTGAAANSVVGAWTTRINVTGVAPTNSFFARVSIIIVGTAANEVNRFDQLQFEVGSAPTAPQYARDQRIVLYADRINEIVDPSFEGTLASWSVTNAALTAASAVAPLFGAQEGVLTASAAGNITLTSSQMKVYPGNPYTSSGYVYSVATARSAYITISWYTAGAVLISTTTFSASNTTVGSWIRFSAKNFIAPSNAATATTTLTIVGTALNEVHYVDGFLFELSSSVNPYFDGSTPINYASVVDYQWGSGGVNNAPSYNYTRKIVKNARTTSLLNNYLPLGSTLTLLYAQGV